MSRTFWVIEFPCGKQWLSGMGIGVLLRTTDISNAWKLATKNEAEHVIADARESGVHTLDGACAREHQEVSTPMKPGDWTQIVGKMPNLGDEGEDA